MRRLAFIAAVLAVLAGLLFFLRPTSVDSPTSQARALTLPWPKGRHATYDFEWTSTEKVVLPVGEAPATESKISWKGRLRVLTSDDARTLLVAVDELSHAELQLLGAPVEVPVSTFVGPKLRASLDEAGGIAQVSFTRDTPQLAQHLLLALTRSLTVELPPGAEAGSWQAVRKDRFGTSTVQLTALDARRLDRKLLRYDTVDAVSAQQREGARTRASGNTLLSLDADGLPTSYVSTVELAVDDASGRELVRSTEAFTAKLAHRQSARNELFASTDYVSPDERSEDEEAAELQRHLEQRAEGMTVEEVREDLQRVNGGVFLDHTRWLWRVTAMIQLHPELCADLVRQFQNPKTTLTGRALLLDLLGNAGTPEAQAALREALETKGLQQQPGYGQLLQRLSLLEKPTAESAAWLERKFQQPVSADERVAAAASLGAMSRKFSEWGDGERAQRYARQLREAAASASSEEQRALLLRAMGNAGSADNRAYLTGAVAAPSPAVREAAAFALRHDHAPEVTRTLLSLVRDPSGSVQQTALSVLEDRPLDAAQVKALREEIEKGALGFANDHAAVSLLQKHASEPGVLDTLQRILERNPGDAELQARIRSLVAQFAAR